MMLACMIPFGVRGPVAPPVTTGRCARREGYWLRSTVTLSESLIQ